MSNELPDVIWVQDTEDGPATWCDRRYKWHEHKFYNAALVDELIDAIGDAESGIRGKDRLIRIEKWNRIIGAWLPLFEQRKSALEKAK